MGFGKDFFILKNYNFANFENSYLRAQMELYGRSQYYTNQKLAILSIYKVFRALQPLIDSPERRVQKSLYFVKYAVSGPPVWWILCAATGEVKEPLAL